MATKNTIVLKFLEPLKEFATINYNKKESPTINNARKIHTTKYKIKCFLYLPLNKYIMYCLQRQQ